MQPDRLGITTFKIKVSDKSLLNALLKRCVLRFKIGKSLHRSDGLQDTVRDRQTGNRKLGLCQLTPVCVFFAFLCNFIKFNIFV